MSVAEPTQDYATNLCAYSLLPLVREDGQKPPRSARAKCPCGREVEVIRGQIEPHVLRQDPKAEREREIRRLVRRRAAPVPQVVGIRA